MHRVHVDSILPEVGGSVFIEGEEAVHATRVKRLGPGDALRLLDGQGVLADGVIQTVHRGGRRGGELSIEVRIVRRTTLAPTQPELHVFTATPKGARVDDLIDQLSQLGAASWSPLLTERTVVDPRESKLARLERIAREAAKQCGRAWMLRIGAPQTFSQAIQPGAARVVLADASGRSPAPAEPACPSIRLLVGPEGGWTPAELSAASAASATVTRFGPHTMRIETAAVAAAAVIMSGSLSPDPLESRTNPEST